MTAAEAPLAQTIGAAIAEEPSQPAFSARLPAPPRAAGAKEEANATEEENSSPPWVSLLLILYWNLLTVTNIVIVVPTAEQYSEKLGADEMFTGLMISLTPFLAVVGVALNHWMLRLMSMQTMMFVVAFGAVAGNCLYALAGLTRSKWSLLAARSIIGLCAGQLIPGLYITRTVGIRKRSQAMFSYQASIALGYAVGPLIAWLLEVFVKELHVENLILDSDTVPGWCMACLYFAFLLKLYLVFEEPAPEPALAPQGPEPSQPVSKRRPSVGLMMCLCAIFASNLSTGMVEVYTAKLAAGRWGWDVRMTSLLLAGVMTCIVPMCLSVGRITRMIDDRKGLLIVCPLGILASVPLCNFGLHDPVQRTALFSAGLVSLLSVCAVLKGFAFSTASKLVPGHLKHLVSTFTISCACLGRGAGSLLGAVMEWNYFAGAQMTIFTLVALLIVSSYRQLRPHEKAC